MDLRLGLSLLLFLAYASRACSKATRDGPTIPPRHNSHQHHRHHRQLQRAARALDEFLVPPPAPSNFRGPRGPHPPPPPPLHQLQNGNHALPAPLPPPPSLSPQPPQPPKQHRNGRYVNQLPGNSGNGVGYFSNLMNWLNPFSGNKEEQNTRDSHVQAASNFPKNEQITQYAPHQPYTNGGYQYEAPPPAANLQTGHSNLASWMSGKPCNPCNQIPWIPVLRESFPNQGQYASNAGNQYLPPPPPQEIKVPDFSQVPQQNYPPPNPHLYPGVMHPLFKAKPFNDGSANLHQSPPIHYNQPPPNLDQYSHQLTQDLGPPPEPIFNNHVHQNLELPPPPPPPSQTYNQQPQINFDQQPPPNFDQSSSPNVEPPQNFEIHPPVQNIHVQAPPNVDHSPISFEQPIFNSPPPNNDQHPPSNFNSQPSQSYDDHPPPEFEQNSSNFDYDPSSNFDHPSNYEDQHSSSNFEQHHQPSQIVGVIKEPPSDLNKLNAHQEPIKAESRPVFSDGGKSSSILRIAPTSETSRFPTTTTASVAKQVPKSNAILHFQRSPLIDLTVAGESSSTTAPSNRFREQPVTSPPSKGKAGGDHRESPTPSATLIDYIVSSGGETFGSNEAEKETRPPPRPQHQSERTVVPLSVTSSTSTTSTSTTTTSTTSTTTQRPTTVPMDQKRQESLIETLVQSYEFYKKNSSRANDTKEGGRLFESDDFSASREVIVPNKDNGKKSKQIIQIIIPYTSQYTPSPFHPTRSVDGQAKKPDHAGGSPGITAKEKAPPPTLDGDNVEDTVLSQESRRVSVTRTPPERLLHNNETGRLGNAIDVHRLQKNIDNWTIQEYSKITTSVTNSPNSTYPRWLSSKQIPDEYLLSTTEFEESSEYYDFSNETDVRRGTNQSEERTKPANASKVKIVNATYPKKPGPKRTDSERVYVVTPIPNPNSLEDLGAEKDPTRPKIRKPKHNEPVERAYQVLPQAVNSLAALSSPPESAAPALWGIMEHEEIAAGAEQPRWRSELDALPEPASTPILYAGHSKVSRSR